MGKLLFWTFMSVVPDAPASGRSLHQDPGLMTKVMRRSMREMEALMEERSKEKAFAKEENEEAKPNKEALREVNKEKDFAKKEDVSDPSEQNDDKTPVSDVGKVIEKKSLEMLDGNAAGDATERNDTTERNGTGEGADLKGGEGEVDLKFIFSLKEPTAGNAGQNFEKKKKRRLKNPTEGIEGQTQRPSEERTESQIGTHLIGTLCKDCGVVLTRNFKKHLLSHTGLRNYMCTFCSKTFILKSHLARHTRVLHNDGQMGGKLSESSIGTTCTECGEVLARDFRRHLESHSGRNYVCTFCSKTFMLKATLTGHTRTFHSDENIHVKDIPVKIHECSKCNFRSHLRDSLVRHNVNIHKAPRPKICIDCGKGFYKNVYLNNHVCPVKKKIREAPKNKSTRICNPCDIKFKFKEGLFRHNTKVHGMSKPFSCAECGKGFIRNANLTIHNRVHTGEKPHICEVCGSGFIDQSGLTRHIEKHEIDF